MTQTFKQVFPIILVHIAVGFIVVFVFSMTGGTRETVLSPFEYAFKLCDVVNRFTSLFPALVTAGLLIGFSMAFRKIIPEAVNRWSPKILSSLIHAFIICVICIGLYVLLAEWLAPSVRNRQETIKAKTDSYEDYIFLAHNATTEGNFRAALSNAEAALAIWDESPQAARIAENARLKLSESGEYATGAESFALEPAEDASPLRNGLSSFEFLEKARDAMARLDFYNAHYYAMLSWQTAAANDPNKQTAMRIASEAWNSITTSLDAARALPDRQWYERKHQGYTEIQAKDFLSAYYLFQEMDIEQKKEGSGIDPDIERLLGIAKQGLLQAFFFTDETKNLRLFEQSRDVFFTITRADGGKDAILMRGVARQYVEKKDAAYLRDFEMIRFDADNHIEFHIAAPYVKMFSFSQDDKQQPRPLLILTAVDREKENAVREPKVISGKFPPANSVAKSVICLEMPYKDINLLFSATAGPELMTLAELFYFSLHSEAYGMERYAFLAEFIRRLCDPFIVFTVAIILLTWAWKFRLGKNRPFSAWWIIVMPLVTIACAYLIETARYITTLCIACASMFPAIASPAILLLVALEFLVASVYFFSQRSD